MNESGFAIRRDPCLQCESRELCGICELNILRQKEQTLKRDEYKKVEEIKMRNENENTIENKIENTMMRCGDTVACTCEAYSRSRLRTEPPTGDTVACTCEAYNPYEATVHLMLSEDYKARFVAEYRQTKIRYERLKKFCNRIEEAQRCRGKLDEPLHDCDLDLLREQQSAMGHYLHVLEIRAEIERIEL